MSGTVAAELQRNRAQLEDVARRIDLHRRGADTAPEVAGAYAAIEWLLGRTEVGPIVGTILPVAGNLSYEAGRATMAADEYGLDLTSDPVVKLHARGVERILYWAKDGTNPLPGWLRATR